MERKFFVVIYREDGEEKIEENYETVETLKKRLQCYKENNIEILNVEEKIVVTQYINMENQLKKWGI